jgi:hypothetical protein
LSDDRDSDLDLEWDDADADDDVTSRRRASVGRRRSATTNRWMRWLHVYTSMISLIIVLFFGVTGLTLNHPSWTLGDDTDRSTYTGELPADFAVDGHVDFLTVSEFIRSEHDVSGEVTDHELNGNDGTISYRAPGYAADLFFEVRSGTYRITIEQQGFVGVMNDLHKGPMRSWRSSTCLLVLVFTACIHPRSAGVRRWALRSCSPVPSTEGFGETGRNRWAGNITEASAISPLVVDAHRLRFTVDRSSCGGIGRHRSSPPTSGCTSGAQPRAVAVRRPFVDCAHRRYPPLPTQFELAAAGGHQVALLRCDGSAGVIGCRRRVAHRWTVSKPCIADLGMVCPHGIDRITAPGTEPYSSYLDRSGFRRGAITNSTCADAVSGASARLVGCSDRRRRAAGRPRRASSRRSARRRVPAAHRRWWRARRQSPRRARSPLRRARAPPASRCVGRARGCDAPRPRAAAAARRCWRRALAQRHTVSGGTLSNGRFLMPTASRARSRSPPVFTSTRPRL